MTSAVEKMQRIENSRPYQESSPVSHKKPVIFKAVPVISTHVQDIAEENQQKQPADIKYPVAIIIASMFSPMLQNLEERNEPPFILLSSDMSLDQMQGNATMCLQSKERMTIVIDDLDRNNRSLNDSATTPMTSISKAASFFNAMKHSNVSPNRKKNLNAEMQDVENTNEIVNFEVKTDYDTYEYEMNNYHSPLEVPFAVDEFKTSPLDVGETSSSLDNSSADMIAFSRAASSPAVNQSVKLETSSYLEHIGYFTSSPKISDVPVQYNSEELLITEITNIENSNETVKSETKASYYDEFKSSGNYFDIFQEETSAKVFKTSPLDFNRFKELSTINYNDLADPYLDENIEKHENISLHKSAKQSSPEDFSEETIDKRKRAPRCTKCDLKFRNKSALESHLRSVHPETTQHKAKNDKMAPVSKQKMPFQIGQILLSGDRKKKTENDKLTKKEKPTKNIYEAKKNGKNTSKTILKNKEENAYNYVKKMEDKITFGGRTESNFSHEEGMEDTFRYNDKEAGKYSRIYCDGCGTSFSKISNLNRHIKLERCLSFWIRAMKKKCLICGKTFSHNAFLLQHIKRGRCKLVKFPVQ